MTPKEQAVKELTTYFLSPQAEQSIGPVVEIFRRIVTRESVEVIAENIGVTETGQFPEELVERCYEYAIRWVGKDPELIRILVQQAHWLQAKRADPLTELVDSIQKLAQNASSVQELEESLRDLGVEVIDLSQPRTLH